MPPQSSGILVGEKARREVSDIGKILMGNLSARHIHACQIWRVSGDPEPNYPPRPNIKNYSGNPCCNCLEHHTDFPCEYCGNEFSTIEDRKLNYEMMWDAWNEWKDEQ
ncbi:uncharacterized protein LOC132307461 isoform X2 [Cornus florida]|uniref:uncharacterized protein LOC132307461 isoform X2 n=1 Tax=Cornus florida TaxID=4283 RepID=UPI00289CF834|nr:uncharacterized protein LOC132307461 isoform X2 [Cornus florida]